MIGFSWYIIAAIWDNHVNYFLNSEQIKNSAFLLVTNYMELKYKRGKW